MSSYIVCKTYSAYTNFLLINAIIFYDKCQTLLYHYYHYDGRHFDGVDVLTPNPMPKIRVYNFSSIFPQPRKFCEHTKKTLNNCKTFVYEHFKKYRF